MKDFFRKVHNKIKQICPECLSIYTFIVYAAFWALIDIVYSEVPEYASGREHFYFVALTMFYAIWYLIMLLVFYVGVALYLAISDKVKTTE